MGHPFPAQALGPESNHQNSWEKAGVGVLGVGDGAGGILRVWGCWRSKTGDPPGVVGWRSETGGSPGCGGARGQRQGDSPEYGGLRIGDRGIPQALWLARLAY